MTEIWAMEIALESNICLKMNEKKQKKYIDKKRCV